MIWLISSWAFCFLFLVPLFISLYPLEMPFLYKCIPPLLPDLLQIPSLVHWLSTGDSWQYLETFLLATTGGGECCWYLVGRGQSYCQDYCESNPQTIKNYPAPNVKSATHDCETLLSPGWFFPSPNHSSCLLSFLRFGHKIDCFTLSITLCISSFVWKW